MLLTKEKMVILFLRDKKDIKIPTGQLKWLSKKCLMIKVEKLLKKGTKMVNLLITITFITAMKIIMDNSIMNGMHIIKKLGFLIKLRSCKIPIRACSS